MVATARMKFASEARLSQYIVLFCNTKPTCMHYLDTLWTLWVGSFPSVPDGEIQTQTNL